MEINKLKQKLLNGQTVYGPFCKLQDPSLVEIAALVGFDFVILDMEHGPLSVESVQTLARAAQAKGIEVVVRVTDKRASDILRILDVGVNSIQVPQVNTATDAQMVVDASFFYPKGERGMCKYVRAASYTRIEKKEYFSSANLGTLTIVHIEGNKGLDNLEQIVSLEGIDIVFLGPYDLSQSFGHPGQTNHPEVVNKMKQAVTLAKNHNKIIGTFCESPQDVKKWRDLGVQYIAYTVDVGIIYDAYKKIINQIKK